MYKAVLGMMGLVLLAILSAVLVWHFHQQAGSQPPLTTAASISNSIQGTVDIGDIAPDFTLLEVHDADKPERVTLSALADKGPVVVVFYLSYSCSRLRDAPQGNGGSATGI